MQWDPGVVLLKTRRISWASDYISDLPPPQTCAACRAYRVRRYRNPTCCNNLIQELPRVLHSSDSMVPEKILAVGD